MERSFTPWASIQPTLTDPATAQAAITAAATARDGGPFNLPDIPGASGYATVYLANFMSPRVLLVGFDLSESHLVPISEEDIDYGDPAVTARDVVDRATLKAFVDGSRGVTPSRTPGVRRSWPLSRKPGSPLRAPNGPWRHGSVYLAIMDTLGHQVRSCFTERSRTGIRAPPSEAGLPATSRPENSSCRSAHRRRGKWNPEGGFVGVLLRQSRRRYRQRRHPQGGLRPRDNSGQHPVDRTERLDVPAEFIINSGFYLSVQRSAEDLVGRLENPGPDSSQSGVRRTVGLGVRRRDGGDRDRDRAGGG